MVRGGVSVKALTTISLVESALITPGITMRPAKPDEARPNKSAPKALSLAWYTGLVMPMGIVCTEESRSVTSTAAARSIPKLPLMTGGWSC